jgi:hypothetical protein
MNIKSAVAVVSLSTVFFLVSHSAVVAKDYINQITNDDYSGSIINGNNELFNEVASYNYWPYIQLGGAKFFNIDTAKGALGVDVFAPLWQQQSQLVFAHLRLFDRSGPPFEGNFHVGYRQLDLERDHLYGVYGAFDRKHSEYGNYFDQLTFGVEGWFGKIFVGANFYLPLGDNNKFIGITDETASFNRVQNNIWITPDKMYEQAMHGGDVAFGYELSKGLVGYVGGYYFKAKDIDNMYGPKARLVYDWSLDNSQRILKIFDKFGLETGIQRDYLRGTTYYLGVNVRIGLLPNEGANLPGVAAHMQDLVQRDVDIVSSTITKSVPEIYRASNGEPITVPELTGGSTKVIDSKQLQQLLANEKVEVISIKGDIYHDVSTDLPQHSQGKKILVFGNILNIISPYSGKILEVDISTPDKKPGRILKKAVAILEQQKMLVDIGLPATASVAEFNSTSLDEHLVGATLILANSKQQHSLLTPKYQETAANNLTEQGSSKPTTTTVDPEKKLTADTIAKNNLEIKNDDAEVLESSPDNQNVDEASFSRFSRFSFVSKVATAVTAGCDTAIKRVSFPVSRLLSGSSSGESEPEQVVTADDTIPNHNSSEEQLTATQGLNKFASLASTITSVFATRTSFPVAGLGEAVVNDPTVSNFATATVGGLTTGAKRSSFPIASIKNALVSKATIGNFMTATKSSLITGIERAFFPVRKLWGSSDAATPEAIGGENSSSILGKKLLSVAGDSLTRSSFPIPKIGKTIASSVSYVPAIGTINLAASGSSTIMSEMGKKLATSTTYYTRPVVDFFGNMVSVVAKHASPSVIVNTAKNLVSF